LDLQLVFPKSWGVLQTPNGASVQQSRQCSDRLRLDAFMLDSVMQRRQAFTARGERLGDPAQGQNWPPPHLQPPTPATHCPAELELRRTFAGIKEPKMGVDVV
jgi:hypothetical protein